MNGTKNVCTILQILRGYQHNCLLGNYQAGQLSAGQLQTAYNTTNNYSRSTADWRTVSVKRSCKSLTTMIHTRFYPVGSCPSRWLYCRQTLAVVQDQWFSTFHGLWPPSKGSQHLFPLFINRVLRYRGRAI